MVRRGLVIVQYTISIVFIVGFLVINKQIDYTVTKNLGYDKNHVIRFQRQGPIDPKDYPTFMTELKNIPGVINASSMFGSILRDVSTNSGFSWKGQSEGQDKVLFPSPVVSHDFIETLNIQIKEGRAFAPEYSDEGSKVILNEAAVRMMEFQTPIGEIIKYGDQEMQVIGVAKNFHYGSLHNDVEPLIFRYSPQRDDILVRIQTGDEQTTIKQIKKLYETFHPKYIFEYTFMDSDYQTLYKLEKSFSSLLKYFTLIALIISCLGLFGLAAFVTQKRFKEICIRKVCGSTVLNIVLLLSSDFTKVIIISIVLALPLGYLITEDWLNRFAYRIPLEWTYFVEAGLLALIVAWFTIGTLIFKAARVSPTQGLKEE